MTCSYYEAPRARFWVSNSEGTLVLIPVDTRLGQKCLRIVWSKVRTGSKFVIYRHSRTNMNDILIN